jgi:hypothetical protein
MVRVMALLAKTSEPRGRGSQKGLAFVKADAGNHVPCFTTLPFDRIHHIAVDTKYASRQGQPLSRSDPLDLALLCFKAGE